jgi:hypothetical protein
MAPTRVASVILVVCAGVVFVLLLALTVVTGQL